MMPTVEEICVKELVKTNINSSIEDAVKKMACSNVRSILVLDENINEYFIFTTTDAIEYKILNISLQKKLKDIKLKKARKIDAKVSILEILQDEENSYEYLVVVSNDQILGILSQSDIINNIDPEILMHRQSIGNLILQYAPVTLYENEAAINAIKLMQLKHIDAIIIIDQTNTPCGIFTSKDFLNIINDDADLSLPINNFMSSPILTLPDTVRIYKALEFIKEKHFKRIVVKDQTGQISGVITQSELLRIVNNKWLDLIKEKGNELSKINEKLLKQTAHLEKKASTDFLTQLHNRRKFDSIISYELQQLKRYTKRDLSVILLDIDGFKYINDTYGHNIGDEILKEIAKILKVTLRTSDVACRWGGEEFAIALSETNIESAYLVAEKLRATIENYIFIDELRITCSFGVSQYQTTDDYPILFKRADEALYKAKNTGKNKVVIEHI